MEEVKAYKALDGYICSNKTECIEHDLIYRFKELHCKYFAKDDVVETFKLNWIVKKLVLNHDYKMDFFQVMDELKKNIA